MHFDTLNHIVFYVEQVPTYLQTLSNVNICVILKLSKTIISPQGTMVISHQLTETCYSNQQTNERRLSKYFTCICDVMVCTADIIR